MMDCCGRALLPAPRTADDIALAVTGWLCRSCGARYDWAPEELAPLAESACPHKAGSEGKIAEMEARAARGEAIFHPRDNPERLRAPSSQTGGAVDRAVAERTRDFPRGVTWVAKKYAWRATLWVQEERRRYSLGLYNTPEEAARAVEEARARVANGEGATPPEPRPRRKAPPRGGRRSRVSLNGDGGEPRSKVAARRGGPREDKAHTGP